MNLQAPEPASSNRLYVTLAAASGVVVLLILAAILVGRGTGNKDSSGQPTALPFGAAEQAYAAQIHFSSLRLTQASNMLNQEFTYVVGTVSNSGNRSVRAIEVTVEFHDLINQLVLRDTVPVFPPGTPPLSPSHERDFQLTFEHVPAGWNHQPPSIRITGLDLQ